MQQTEQTQGGATPGGGPAGAGTGSGGAPAKRKLNTKDLIIAGAFAAVYLVVLMIVVSGLGIVPILYLAAPFFAAVVLGPIFAVYCTKLNKPGAILILAVLVGIFESIGGAWLSLVWAVLVGLVAELLARAGRYHSKRFYKASYIVFALTNMGPFWYVIFMKEAFLASCVQYGGQEYAAALDALTPAWIPLVLMAIALIGGFIGAVLGQRLLRKHFEKAGVV